MQPWLVLLTLLLSPVVFAQSPADSTDTEALDEAVLETLVDDDVSGDPTVLLETLEDLRDNPLDINRATAEQLALIPSISPILAETIARFREQFGEFDSLPELRAVEGVTEDVYAAARPYLSIGEVLDVVAPAPSAYPNVPSLQQVVRGLRYEVRQRVQRRLDEGRGYSDALRDDTTRSSYSGSPERIYTRLRATYRRQVSANLTLEKDPGELFTWAPDQGSYGYDFASAHVAVLDAGRLDALIVGDFTAEFGQGVALWRPSGFGKGRELRPIVRSGRGLRPYSSVEENQFFRGVAATVAATPELYLSAFGSRRSLDANVVRADTSLAGSLAGSPGDAFGDTDALATSLPITGFHRTATELARKDALDETLFGGATELRLDRATVGLVGYTARFDTPIQRGARDFQRFDFEGETASMLSAYFDVTLLRNRDGGGGYQAFGEVARAPGGAVGGIVGTLAKLGREVEALVVARHYPRDFVSLHGYAFGERNGVTQNETGLYLGLRLRPARNWTVTGFFDQYRFPYLRFTVPRPATGYEALLYVEHRPTRWLTVYAQGRTETREVGLDVADPNGSVVGGLTTETRQTLRLHGSYLANRALRLRARVEVARYQEARLGGEPDGDAEFGVLLFQDVRWQTTDWLRLDARLTFFDTASFDARLYQFESDATGVLTNVVLTGRGTRAYLLATIEPMERVRFQAKLSQTRFEDRFTVGSGLDEVEGPQVRDLTVQLQVQF
ncbi:MAG: helix-hairpin-helix domain-containing protein [Bacteroidota bacterium]